MAAGGRRRRRLVHAHDLGLDRAAEDRAAPAGAVDSFTDWAAEQFDIGPGTIVANYAPLNFDLCLLDIWTTLKHGGCVVLVDQDRATNGGYLADLLTDNEVNVLQAVPMLYRLLIDVTREDGRSFPSVSTRSRPGTRSPRARWRRCPACSPTPASSTSTAARRPTTA